VRRGDAGRHTPLRTSDNDAEATRRCRLRCARSGRDFDDPEGVDHPGGGEWANVATNWLRWQFKGDKQAAKMFVGKDCSLCTNSNWDAASKHLQ
jgi:hypothetical protein